jgi:ABC-type multidrug transport system ATPase subunit
MRGQIGHCPAEDNGFYPRLTVRENLEFFAALYGLSAPAAPAPLAVDFAELPWERCSLGMRQRVKLARALQHRPKLLLLDEPLNGLDQAARGDFERWLKDWAKESGGLAILVQHGWGGGFPRVRLVPGGALCIS